MRPTIDEQLRGVRRLIEGVAAAETLSARSAGALAEARTILRRIESSWAGVLPFLDWDNQATAAVLAEVASLLPGAVPATPPVLAAGVADCELDFGVADERNRALRALLADVVRALPAEGDPADHPAAASARTLIASHLRTRLDRDPTNRRSAR